MIAAPGVEAQDHGHDQGDGDQGVDDHGAGGQGEHGHADPLFAIPLPGFLSFFDGDPTHEGT